MSDARRRTGLSGASSLAGVIRRYLPRSRHLSDQPFNLVAGDRVLLISCNWIGDNFFASQVISRLKARFEAVDWWVLTKPHSRDLWTPLLGSDHIIVSPAVVSDRHRERFDLPGFVRLVHHCRKKRFKGVVDLTGNRYSSLFAALIKRKWSMGGEGDELGFLYSIRTERRIKGRHEREAPWRVVAPMLGGFDPPPEMVPAAPTVDYPALARRLRIPMQGLLAVLAPGGGWPGKCWPVGRFAELAKELSDMGFVVIVVGGPAQEALCRRVIADVPGGVSAAGLPVGEALAIVARADIVVANDSSEGHLAAAHGRPVASLFGPTNPALVRPIGPRAEVVRAECPFRPEGDQLHCRDRAGDPACEECMARISVDSVLRVVDRMLEAQREESI